jgi:PAS domain S-box-containing protein
LPQPEASEAFPHRSDPVADLIAGTLIADALEHAELGVFLYDDEGRYVAVSRRGAEILGCERDEVVDHNVRDFTAGDVDKQTLYSREMRRGVQMVQRKDGSQVRVGFVVTPTTIARLPHRIAIVWELAAEEAP